MLRVEQGDAYAHRKRAFPARHFVRSRHGPLEPLRQRVSISARYLGREHRELVAPKSGDDVGLTERGLSQQARNLEKGAISRLVTQKIVDAFEVVEVREQQPQPVPRAHRGAHLLL